MRYDAATHEYWYRGQWWPEEDIDIVVKNYEEAEADECITQYVRGEGEGDAGRWLAMGRSLSGCRNNNPGSGRAGGYGYEKRQVEDRGASAKKLIKE